MAKFYAVWKGRKTGTFDSWLECKKQVDGFEKPIYKSFNTLIEAEDALKTGFPENKSKAQKKNTRKPNFEAIAVDAAWNTKTGDMEYRGVNLISKKQIFHQGPFKDGTNNIGEFLAIVHALALLHKHQSDLTIFTDSVTALAWVRNKKANTKLETTTRNTELFELISRAEKWLRANPYPNKILKWETEIWGEIPADFGRK